jgi:phenylacetate-coenzyme A ligase PaaK-like adenylate-forming protein
MLEGFFVLEEPMREFSAEEIWMVDEFEPDALVLPLAIARVLAEHSRKPVVSSWMAVLTSLAAPPLSGEDRDLLWRAFGVPVFEQLRGWDGSVLARECEVHDGLHIDENAAIFEIREGELITTQLTSIEQPILRARTGISAELVKEHCECGAETPRLRSLAKIRQKTRYAVA